MGTISCSPSVLWRSPGTRVFRAAMRLPTELFRSRPLLLFSACLSGFYLSKGGEGRILTPAQILVLFHVWTQLPLRLPVTGSNHPQLNKCPSVFESYSPLQASSQTSPLFQSWTVSWGWLCLFAYQPYLRA